ncbi:MAG: acyl--CoA ligase [Oscillospiraceae bacterium]|nr:acyl--CoA ligase [Oscillospiraceae bacterium]
MPDSPPPSNMPQLLAQLERQAGDQPILRCLEDGTPREMTAPQFYGAVHRHAAVLAELSGKHIGIIGPNIPHWLMWFCAVFKAGAVAVLLSPDLDPEQLAQRSAQVDLSCLIYHESLSQIVSQADLPFRTIPMDHQAPSVPALPADPAPESLACILFTSGTTAIPKAVMLSQKAMVASIRHNVVGLPFRAQLTVLPLHHVAGFATVLNTWYLGRMVCLGQDMRYLFRYLQRLEPDYTLLVPSLLQTLVRKLRNGGPNGRDLGWDLHLIGCGGARFQPEVIQILNDHGIRVLQSYGATELGGLGFDTEMTPHCADTIGKAPPEIQVKIRDGELLLRCESMMMGYYGDPDATREVLDDGWYATGDLCRQDGAGYLYLQGRKRDLIILSGGENVSPEWVESRLLTCPQIQEVMVTGEDDLLCATILPIDDSPSTRLQIQEALDRYDRSVPTYHQIHRIHFTQTPFPRTPNGKLIRRKTP